MSCDFPYTYSNTTDTCITYADSIGKPYYDWRIALLVISTTLTFINIVQFVRFVYYFKTNQYRVQFYTLLLSLLMCLTMIIEAIDPEGYMGLVPLEAETLSSNLSTCFGIIIILQLLFSLNSVRSAVYNKINDLLYNGIFITTISVTVISTIVFTLLQIYIDYYTFRGIKFLGFCLVSGITAVYLNVIIKKSLPNNKIATINVKKMTQRVIIHLIFFDTLIAFVVSYLFYTSVTSFMNMGHERHVELGPDSYVFPMCQFISIILALSFTSQIRSKIGDKKTMTDDMKTHMTNFASGANTAISKTVFASYLNKKNPNDIEANVNNNANLSNASNASNASNSPDSDIELYQEPCRNIIIEKCFPYNDSDEGENMSDYYNRTNNMT